MYRNESKTDESIEEKIFPIKQEVPVFWSAN